MDEISHVSSGRWRRWANDRLHFWLYVLMITWFKRTVTKLRICICICYSTRINVFSFVDYERSICNSSFAYVLPPSLDLFSYPDNTYWRTMESRCIVFHRLNWGVCYLSVRIFIESLIHDNNKDLNVTRYMHHYPPIPIFTYHPRINIHTTINPYTPPPIRISISTIHRHPPRNLPRRIIMHRRVLRRTSHCSPHAQS